MSEISRLFLGYQREKRAAAADHHQRDEADAALPRMVVRRAAY